MEIFTVEVNRSTSPVLRSSVGTKKREGTKSTGYSFRTIKMKVFIESLYRLR